LPGALKKDDWVIGGTAVTADDSKKERPGFKNPASLLFCVVIKLMVELVLPRGKGAKQSFPLLLCFSAPGMLTDREK